MGTESHRRRSPAASGGTGGMERRVKGTVEDRVEGRVEDRDEGTVEGGDVGEPDQLPPPSQPSNFARHGTRDDAPSPIRQALRAARRGRHVIPEIDESIEEVQSVKSRTEPATPVDHDQSTAPAFPETLEDPLPETLEDRRVDGFELTIKDFGTAWSSTVQGWVLDEAGHTVWRPIVTTTADVPNWEIDTTLGVVTGEAALNLNVGSIGDLLVERGGRRTVEQRVHRDRVAAHQAMVEAAVARGAHAVVGVTVGYTPLGDVVLVTATGTAVTLRPPDDR
ncbi:MAG: YbjQ family protein [Acidimicrobiia bacterium]|nr:YbjQ family protein [Acidimicrobiia bacterium]NNL27563.1 heavy metal-binding domain-containing protein [Acidimicrobiia bacterium]